MTSPADLVTSQAETRAGFVTLALERNVRATPFVEQARSLHQIASSCKTAIDLVARNDIKQSLLTAAGVSDKAARHWDDQAKSEAVAEFIAKFLDPAGDDFADELVYRFLLTRGDTLGGSMRNIGGKIGERRFTRAVISMLHVKNMRVRCIRGKSRRWAEIPPNAVGPEFNIKAVSWKRGQVDRTLIFNVKVPLSSVNVDVCLLACEESNWADNLNEPSRYLAMGELKGGVDPAGSFEHWATSRSAISKSRAAFASFEAHPPTFFVGASITRTVAEEIWTLNRQKVLSNAANLTVERQLRALCDWLTGL